MKLTDAEMYCNLMAEVKGRQAMLRAVYTQQVNLGNDLARFEFCALLIRKSLEQIAIASLISNRDEFCKAYNYFETARNPRLIFRDIERVNANFYPQPVEEVAEPGKPRVVRGVNDGSFLTRSEFLRVYEKCATLLHAFNPYGSVPDLKYFDTNIPIWRTRIFKLLDKQIFMLAGSSTVYLIHMHEADGHVHHYACDPLPEGETGPAI